MSDPVSPELASSEPQAGSKIEASFLERRATYIALRDEVVFIVTNFLESSAIKIHQIEDRIKSIESVSEKISSGRVGNLDEVVDIVGVRVVCLFKSDLSTIDSLIRQEFEVVDHDNKVDTSDDTFGYMSVHYTCEIKKEYSGPRYDKIRGYKFEVQVRTLCMHAWAAISHYLDYKAEWDIPSDLRKGLNALSGLFYVADSQYEQLYASRQDARIHAQDASPKDASNQSINFDTVRAMLRRIFPERRAVDPEKVSIFVKELIQNKYGTIGEVESAIASVSDYLTSHDEVTKRAQDVKRSGPFFADLGAARVSLRKANSNYEQISFRSPNKSPTKKK